MQLDWDGLMRMEKSLEPATSIRFYRWDQPTVSLGKHQQLQQAVDLDCCRKRGVSVVYRPTGGRAVFHKDEITYAVVSNDTSLFPFHNIHQTYALLARALQQGLRKVGVDSEFSQGLRSSSTFPLSGRHKPCFATPNRHELLHRGRKIAGSAQRRLKRSFLQHGSIALNIDYLEMSQLLGFSEELLRRSMISLSEAAGRTISFEESAQALQEGFKEVLTERPNRTNV